MQLKRQMKHDAKSKCQELHDCLQRLSYTLFSSVCRPSVYLSISSFIYVDDPALVRFYTSLSTDGITYEMSLLQYVRSIYSLDTLDSRFSTSSKTPLNRRNEDGNIADSKIPAQSILASAGERKPLPSAQLSKWNTLEFYIYYLAFLTIPILMVKSVYDVSNPGSPNWDNVSKLLSPGWIPGRQVDNSDAQYASFRNNIPYMAILLVAHPLLRKLYDSFAKVPRGTTPGQAADRLMQRRISFDFGFALIFISALHGVSAVKVLLILYANYKLATGLSRTYVPAATWMFNVGILFANELCRGYPLASVAGLLLPSQTTAASNLDYGQNWATWIDHQGGLIPRWEILFNITVLRLISFNFDYYWSLEQNRGSNALEVCC